MFGAEEQPDLTNIFIYVFFKKIYLFISVRERAQGRGAEEEGEKSSSSILSTKPNTGLRLTTLRSDLR